MMQIHSRQLGTIGVNPEEILDFPEGVPGFERHRRFVLVEKPEIAPIVFLQCVDAPEVCFCTAPAAAIDPTYEISITADDLRAMGLDESRQPSIRNEVLCLAVLAATENGRWVANLLAPIVIEPRRGLGMQAVRMDARYSHRHPVGMPEAPCL